MYTHTQLPWWFSGKESACQCRSYAFNPWVRKIPWRRKWQSTPVFQPGKSHGQRNGGLQSMCCKESDMTWRLNNYIYIYVYTYICIYTHIHTGKDSLKTIIGKLQRNRQPHIQRMQIDASISQARGQILLNLIFILIFPVVLPQEMQC